MANEKGRGVCGVTSGWLGESDGRRRNTHGPGVEMEREAAVGSERWDGGEKAPLKKVTNK